MELFNLRYNYFCFEPIVIFVFLDFVLYEYSSFSSSQEFFLHFGIWKNHSENSAHLVLFWGPKTWLKLGLNTTIQTTNSKLDDRAKLSKQK